MRGVLEKTELIFAMAIILPLVFVFSVDLSSLWLELILGTVMFLSIRPFFRQNMGVMNDWKKIIFSILLNYVLLSGLYLLVASMFFPSASEYFIGYIILAIVPPAVSIIPLCYLTKCDIRVADLAIFVGYVLALIIIPLSATVLFGSQVNLLMLAKTLSIIIVIPLILAYLSRKSSASIFNYTKIFTNLLIGIIIFITVSVNRETLLNIQNPLIVTMIAISFGVIFILGLAVYFISRKFVPEMDAINYSLYATQKNEATGIALALVMFSHQVAIPLIIALVMQFIYFLVLERIIIRNAQIAGAAKTV
jgi:BASS family bile acid:Na+ symporter